MCLVKAAKAFPHAKFYNLSTGYTACNILYLAEVGKAQLEAQSATSATSAIAEVALRFNFIF